MGFRMDSVEWEALVARYGWADGDEFDWYTVSVVAGKTEDQVIAAFGGDPAGTSRTMTFGEAIEDTAAHLYKDYHLLGVLAEGRHVWTMEPGYHGNIPEIARRASANGGEFFSVYEDINARCQVMHAADGRVTGAFDPIGLEDADFYHDLPELPAWAEGATFPMEQLSAVTFALMERTMGVPFDPDLLRTPVRTVTLPAPGVLFTDTDAAWRP
ncbi:conserved hypothetical protein [Actinacidiphila bryophytorum]|uniref:Uncharacterized protein n=2 Tax=Actinacidiphila bryophytorum TaxID=1436133 RepID=A0A9W4H500_9ACTN|nr:conserved hypothetical protein [Actinacidiphila bryophytorum]